MSQENIEVHVTDHVADVVVNRPDKLNALNGDTIAELTTFFEGLSGNDDIGVVVLTGAGEKAFIAGADISMLADQTVTEGRENSRQGQRLTRAIERAPQTVIAAINGYALGGGLEVAFYRGGEMSMEEGLALESDLFGVISSTDEMREGLRAFLDKRDPSWKRKPS